MFDPDQESPCLHIKKGATPETAVVYWTSFFGYDWTLQETPDLNPPGPPFAWVDSVYFPDYFDGIFSVIVPDTDPSRFFRLTKQP